MPAGRDDAILPWAIRRSAALALAQRAGPRDCVPELRPFVLLLGAPAMAERLAHASGREVRAAGGPVDGVRLLRVRSHTPVGAIVEWAAGAEDEVARLWGSVSDLPVLALASASDDAATARGARLGVRVAPRAHLDAACSFMTAAHQHALALHTALVSLAAATRLSPYEAELAWRWTLGQRSDRELSLVLGIAKPTLAERKRRLLRKTGALSSAELVRWVVESGEHAPPGARRRSLPARGSGEVP